MRVRTRVPATTANIGPGFDCLGMALSLYNEVEYEVEQPGFGTLRDELTPVRILSEDKHSSVIPVSKNLVYQAFASSLRVFGIDVAAITLRMIRTDIPIARGLGSSAACIVGGVLAAARVSDCLGGRPVSFAEAMDLAVDLEGHPDNVVPAMAGGMTAAVRVEETELEAREAAVPVKKRLRTVFSRINVPRGLTIAAMVPDFRLTTEDARGVLPDNYNRQDAVFNVGRVALLAAGLASGDLSVLRTATEDRIHQPYRLEIIPHSIEVIAAARAAGSDAEFVSGSGPTIAAMIRGDGARFESEVSSRLAEIPGGWAVHLLQPETSGAQAWVEG